MRELLRLDSVSAGYGQSVIIEGLSLAINEGDAVALLGRNGVGKTTLIATLMGLTRLHAGTVRWRDTDISRLPTHRRVALGIGWVPQERLVFPSLTVAEHLTAVARPGPWTAERVYRLLPRLDERRANYGNQLSGGEQQMLAIGRALMTNPRLLLMDEPMEGLAPIIVAELRAAIDTLVGHDGLAIIIVEQHAKLALGLTRHALVMDRGRIVHSGPSEVLAGAPETLNQLLALS